MNYHNITKDDMRNGEGLRVVLWVSGCSHKCYHCQNPQTWKADSGIEFDGNALAELYDALNHDYISGLTLSGGDPLYYANLHMIFLLVRFVKQYFPDKTIWLYTGYTWEQLDTDIARLLILQYVDVLVDGKFVEKFADVKYHWAGSTNQRIIDVKKTMLTGTVVLHG